MVTRLHRNGMQWLVKPGAEALLPASIPDTVEACRRDPAATLIRDNNVRMSFFYRTDRADLFIKRYKCRSLWDTVKYFFLPSKAVAEWRNLRRFEHLGIATAAPLAVAEQRTARLLRGGCLVTASLAPAEALNEFLLKNTLSPGQRRELSLALAGLVRRLHGANVFFRDLHAGNILITWPGGGQPQLHLIDLHKAFCLPGLWQWMRVRDLAQLCNSLKASRADSIRFLRAYCAGGQAPLFEELRRAIAAKQERLEAVRIKSRSKRCVKHSSVFEKRRTWSERYFGRKDFGRKAAEQAIGLHEAGLARGSARLLKAASKSAVTVHEIDGHGQVCVKGYRDRGLWQSLARLLVKSRALKSWIAANGLLVRGIDTPLPLAVVERTRGPLCREAFLITRFLPGASELNACVQAGVPAERKEAFIAALAAVLRRMHDRGIYHADMKSNNILVQEAGAGWRFSLIDLDRTYFTAGLDAGRRINNLAQINASVAACMTVRDRLKFFRFYAKGTDLYRRRRACYRRVLAISRAKNTAPYGVVFS